MPSPQNEAFSRILIDKALEFSGWDLLNSKQVRFESCIACAPASFQHQDISA